MVQIVNSLASEGALIGGSIVLLLDSHENVPQGATRYLCFELESTPEESELPLPCRVKFERCDVHVHVPPGIGNTNTYTLFKNGASVATNSVPSVQITGLAQDATMLPNPGHEHLIYFPGDRFCIEIIVSGAASLAHHHAGLHFTRY